MARFRLLTENFYNIRQFGSHAITASTYQVGNEPWRVGTGRRSARNSWIAPTTGEQTLRVTCDQVRSADMVALDRGHNIRTLKVQFTNSTAAGWTTHKTLTISTATYPNMELTYGVTTPEGAYICRFAGTTNTPAAVNWRLAVSTTAGATPKVVGAYLGKSFSPSKGALRPWDDEVTEMLRTEVVSPEFWSAASQVAVRRTNSLNVRLTDAEGDQARYHVGNLFWKGEVGWIVPDEDNAERAQLGIAPSGSRGMPYGDWPTRTLNLDWVEHQPKPL